MPTEIRCMECSWRGEEEQALVQNEKMVCPKCGSPVVTGPEEAVDLYDVLGADHLALKHGDRYTGYYLFQNKGNNKELPLGVGELTYAFRLIKYAIQFTIPPKIEFSQGIISYSDAERQMGIFRYPRDREGNFCTPVMLSKGLEETIGSLTPEAMEKLLKAPRPLLFEAFRIPIFRFDFYELTPQNLQEIEALTSKDFAESVRVRHSEILDKTIADILVKIESSPNFLLILQNVLDRKVTDFDAVAKATNNIIHIA